MGETKNEKGTVLAAVDDIFFAAKIRGTGESIGVEVKTARSQEKFFEKLYELKPSKIIVDLHSENIDALEIARKVKSDEALKHIPLIGFFSHVHVELMEKAKRGGFDTVLPRSAFTKNLTKILLE